ncbi:hypothetical protein BELL_0990g00010 [Botrytis elliptica]|uniref:Major facilitator superfamily (MFS) profile domain-containing protein n=1 Tax=Botrytis elliptica TaxID=278938 RepID=A0A4Z1J9X4_9HELO|nr:hypothetical protein BELL_0990g00010 [Botrytis elliptica]
MEDLLPAMRKLIFSIIPVLGSPELICIAVLPAYFDKKQALALGVAASGSAIVGGDVVVGSFFGRMIPTHFADIYGPFNIDIICVLLSGILAFTWITIHITASMILFTVSYGFFSGGLTSISPNLGGAISPDTGVLGVRLGMLLMPISVGILVGNPIAGALESYGWISLQVFTAALLMASLVVVITARILMYAR